jgi:hypothetical protein
MTEIMRHKSFTRAKKREPVTFDLDGDTFECVRKMPMSLTRKISALGDAENSNVNAKLDLFMEILEGLMLDHSYELFNKRLSDKTNPIDVEELSDIIEWLIEVYTGRPLEQSSDSANGSTIDFTEKDGTFSMDGAQAETLIPVSSPSIVS